MRESEIRLECVKLAVDLSNAGGRSDVVEMADDIFRFVRGHSDTEQRAGILRKYLEAIFARWQKARQT